MTTSTSEYARSFAELHWGDKPLLLYNIWDAGSAKAVENAGAMAIATSSWAIAAAHGYDDGEIIPQTLVETIVERITNSVSLPVTVDFEGGYASEPEDVGQNVERLLDHGVVGINFEDQMVGSNGLYEIEAQCDRIRSIRERADTAGVPLFINARTDLFLKEPNPSLHGQLLNDAVRRANAYEEAGANGMFLPGLVTKELIRTCCESISLPVNVMIDKDAVVNELAQVGVRRISYGPAPYMQSASGFEVRAQQLFR